MNIFCLIYPDPVHTSESLAIQENLLRGGAKLVHATIRLLDAEEVKLIFTNRRFSGDYEDFCRAMTISVVWILHLEAPSVDHLYQYLNEEQALQVFIPTETSVHKTLLKLGDDFGYSKEKLLALIVEMRQKIAQEQQTEDRDYAASAVINAQKMFTYFAAMQVVGFSEKQAFALTEAMHHWLLLEGDDNLSPPSSSGNDKNEEDD